MSSYLAKRVCTLCKTGIGDEIHALFDCQHEEIKTYRNKYLTNIKTVSPQINLLTNTDKLFYILKATDIDIIQITCEWLRKIDTFYKKSL